MVREHRDIPHRGDIGLAELEALIVLRAQHGDFAELSAAASREAASDNTYWSKDLYQDHPSRWGLAASAGDLSKYTIWRTRESTICLAFNGGNFDSNLSVECSSRAHDGLGEASRESEILADL